MDSSRSLGKMRTPLACHMRLRTRPPGASLHSVTHRPGAATRCAGSGRRPVVDGALSKPSQRPLSPHPSRPHAAALRTVRSPVRPTLVSDNLTGQGARHLPLVGLPSNHIASGNHAHVRSSRVGGLVSRNGPGTRRAATYSPSEHCPYTVDVRIIGGAFQNVNLNVPQGAGGSLAGRGGRNSAQHL